MEDGSIMLHIAAIIGLLIVNIIFYGFGAALQELNETLLEKNGQEGDRKAMRLYQLKTNPSSFINTIQLVVMLADILLGAFLLQTIPNRLVSIVCLMFLFLSLGVLAPKRLAAWHCEKWAYTLVNLVYAVTWILTPVTFLIKLTTDLILRLFGIDPKAAHPDVTEEEIISMVNEGQEQGVLEKREAEMIANIFEFGDKEAKDIMTHRKNIVALDVELTLEEAVQTMLSEKNSRYSVYEEDIDNVLGILHIKDAMKQYKEPDKREWNLKSLDGLLGEAKFIPETRNIDDLFKTMQAEKTHMVIVIDEYGQTSGIVTMEDVLEEIVGNILDEYDEEEEHIKKNEDSTYVMNGMTTLEEAGEILGIEFDEECDTINGFMISNLGRIPEEGEDFSMDYEGFNFRITAVEDKMISTVLVTKLTPDAKEVEETEK